MTGNTSVPCTFCGLPAPPSADSPAYCCYGCRFAAAVTAAHGEEGETRWALARLGVAGFLSMNVMVFAMALWTQDFYDDPASLTGRLPHVLRGLFRWLSMLFALPVLFLLGGPLLADAWDGLRRRLITSDFLLVLGVAASYLYSAVSVLRDDGAVYFEIGCAVLVLVTLSRWLEACNKLRAVAALDSLQRLLPDRVRRLDDAGETSVPLAEIAAGDVLHVLAGERIPCDGCVERQPATVDEQVVTGESRPVVKEPGDAVHAGGLNLDGGLVLRATAPAAGSSLARLIERVQEARKTKSRSERAADRVTMVFVPAVMAVAVLAAVWRSSHDGLAEGVMTGLAVLLIACPCALGLATSLAVWVGLDEAARAGVFFRNGEALERLAGVRAMRLDKTGTLTTGAPTIAACLLAPDVEPAAAFRWAWQLARCSTHGYSLAIQQFADTEAAAVPARLSVRTLPGRGLLLDDPQHGQVCLGSARMLDAGGQHWPASLTARRLQAERDGSPFSCLAWGGAVRALFVFSEQLRPESAAALAQLRGLGLDLELLTGDGAAGAAAVGRALGVPVRAQLLPEDKVAALAEARAVWGAVAMVGDGINDAPALARADVSFAMGAAGSDTALETAGVALMADDLRGLPAFLRISRAARQVLRQNIAVALATKFVFFALALAGLATLWAAVVADMGASLAVVANSLRLLRTQTTGS